MKNFKKLLILFSTPFILMGCSGEVGPQGEKGDKGDKGDTGERGSAGQNGLDGDPGKSAYEIYLEYHPDYKKSEEEWINEFCKEEKKFSLADFEGKEYYRANLYECGVEPIYTFSDDSFDGQAVDEDIYSSKIVIENQKIISKRYSTYSSMLNYYEEECYFLIFDDFIADDDIIIKITDDYYWWDGFYLTIECAERLGFEVAELSTMLSE